MTGSSRAQAAPIARPACSSAITPTRRWRQASALLVAGCFFMEFLDGTIVSTAAPSIGRDFHVSSESIAVVVTAYLLALAVLIPLSGWLADRFGARPVFLTAIAVFTLASAACAVSTNLGEVVALRVILGTGGAMMVPVGRLVVLAGTAKTDLIRTIALLTWPALVAPVLAPLIGGLITTYTSWRWIFLINVPLGVVALALAARLITSVPPGPPRRLDWVAVGAIAVRAGGPMATGLSLGHGPRLAYAVAFVLLAALTLTATARAVRIHPSVGDAVRRPSRPGRAAGARRSRSAPR